MVVAVGGGSQAVGALTVARALRPGARGLRRAGRAAPSAIHDSWHAGQPRTSKPSADTFADGLATRNAYAMTFRRCARGWPASSP